ncbi:MAG: hypothetical protein IPK69_01660 [Phycisphaerales bacterium]|nr:MAG: hypothetical protein IPK69_01660 [Phycisphaerales bacterium]
MGLIRQTRGLGEVRWVVDAGAGRGGRGLVARRFGGVHADRQTSHTLYRFDGCGTRGSMRRLLGALESMAGVRESHLLAIEGLTLSSEGGGRAVVVITPYLGDSSGLRTLRDHLEAKLGRILPSEVAWAMRHVLGGLGVAHAGGLVEGALRAERCLLDRYGKVTLELHGLPASLGWIEQSSVAAFARREVRDAVAMAYSMLAGREFDRGAFSSGAAGHRTRPEWDAWFAAGLLGHGFESAGEAMAALPSERGGSGGRVIERSASTSSPENGGNFGEGTSEASVKKSVLRQWLDGLRGLPAGRSGRAA